LVAVLFGYGTGVVGMIITHRQEAESGPLPHHFELEWATAPAFPGFIMAELLTDHEWHADKTWCSGQDVSFWNAGFWGLAAMIMAVPSAVTRYRGGIWKPGS